MPTRKAFVYLLLAFVLFIVAANLQSGWIYLLVFFLLSEIFHSFYRSRVAFKRAEVHREAPFRAEANSVFSLEYRFSNMPEAFFIHEKALKITVKAEGRTGRAECELKLKRGIYALDEIVVETFLPSGLFRAKRSFNCEQKLIVWPEIDGEDVRAAEEFLSGAGELSSVQKKKGGDYAGIREYQVGDPLRKIHWKKTAQYRQVLVRDDVDAFRKSVVLMVDNSIGGDDECFEDLLSVARTISEHLMRRGFELRLLYFKDGRPSELSGGIFDVNDLLAGLKPEQPVENFSAEALNGCLCIAVTSSESMPLDKHPMYEPVVVFVGNRFPAAYGGRVIRVLKRDGKRQWLF